MAKIARRLEGRRDMSGHETPAEQPTTPATTPAAPPQAADWRDLVRPDPDLEHAGRQRAEDLLSSYEAGIGPRRRAFSHALTTAVDGTLDGIRRHWLAILNTTIGGLVGLAVLAPVGYALGLTGVSGGIFDAYRVLCAQTPSHSFFVFGYQVCLCSRCLAIYSSVLLGGLLLSLVRGRRNVRALDWRFWVLALLPMALDGGTQLFGWRESNLGLRLLTGTIFGLATAWFLLPQIEQASYAEEGARQPLA
jgi:uncharacterized membrane protein